MPVCTCTAGQIEVGDRVVFIIGYDDADWEEGPPHAGGRMSFSEGIRKPVKEVSPDGKFFTLSPWPPLWAPCSAAIPFNKPHAPSCRLLLPPDALERFSHI